MAMVTMVSAGNKAVVLLCAAVMLAFCAAATAQQSATGGTANKLAFTVVDENGVAVPSALILLTLNDRTVRCETDFAGRCELSALSPGTYSMRVGKIGFYRLDLPALRFPEVNALDIKLVHEQEIRETVDVVESPPAIDPDRTATTETLGQREILNVPYATSRDIRNALPLLPQVVMDMSGNIHVAGSSALRTLSLLDGFDVGAPAPGFLDMRVNVDSIRTVDVETSRYTAQFGRGDNVVGINTGIGDNQFRFTATNFVPSFQTRKGIHFNQWVPRATLSGPIKKNKIWFFEAPEAEYDLVIVPELPDGQDSATSWRTGNLTKVQINFTSSNIFTSEFVVNSFHAPHAGLSPLAPLPTTVNQRGASYLAAFKDQQYFKNGTLVEFGLAFEDYNAQQDPLGNVPFEITPENVLGSFYQGNHGGARRFQWITNAFLAPRQWHGRHDVKMGIDLDRVTYHRNFDREPINILREDGTLARRIVFTGLARTQEANLQSALYLQDRWTPRERLLVEAGARMDWDEIIRDPVFAPRVALTYMLNGNGNTKLSGGIGLFYAATNLEMISRPITGRRADFFFAPDGTTLISPPVLTQFFVNEDVLKQPRTFNWSLGLDQKLPHAVYLRVDFLQKRGTNNFVFVNTAGPTALVGNYLLTNGRNDHYDAITFTVRHTFKNIYPIMVAYTRSSARTNTLLDYNLDAAVLGAQQGGRLPWDAPNRLVAWGWLPFIKKFDIGYSAEWRDGFPFSAVNEGQVIAGAVDSYRFPRFFTAALAFERRFHVAGLYLAFRGTVENVSNERNPSFVNNNVNSPQFLQFSGLGHRVLTGRIRFLGRTKGAAQPQATPAPNDKP